MSSDYNHLSFEERVRIETLKSEGLVVRQTAGRLKRSPSTVSRELRRNRGKEVYRHDRAQELAENRRSNAASPRKMTTEFCEMIDGMLTNCQFSPVQTAGRLKYEELAGISTTSIYRYIRRKIVSRAGS